MKTHFNLATSPLENNRRFIAGSVALGAVALAALGLLSVHAVRARRVNRETRADIARLEDQIRAGQAQQERLRAAFRNPHAVEVMERSQFLNRLIEERAFPWTKMFADLERILPPGVRVMSISPQMEKDGSVNVVQIIGAANDEQEDKFVQSLTASPVFSNVKVTEETHPQRVSAGAATNVLFQLEARYAI
ncbi:MAG: PilN domain-containing protein [Candidatus Acidiferrales bacterium]